MQKGVCVFPTVPFIVSLCSQQTRTGFQKNGFLPFYMQFIETEADLWPGERSRVDEKVLAGDFATSII